MQKLHTQNPRGFLAFFVFAALLILSNFMPDSVLAAVMQQWPDPTHKAIVVFEWILILLTISAVVAGPRQRGEATANIALVLGHILCVWYLFFN